MLTRSLVASLAALALVAPPGEETGLVTIRAEARRVTFGERVTLSGTVAPMRGEHVVVHALPFDGGEDTLVADQSDGRWRAEWAPQITTQFRATTATAESAEAPVVAVRPRVHLVVISARRGRFYTRAEALFSYRGRTATFERLGRRGWRPVKRVRLGSRSAVRFRAVLPRGRSHVRVVVAKSPGYARGVSRTALVRR